MSDVPTPTPSPAVLSVTAAEVDSGTLLALGRSGYRYDATGVSGRLYFVRDNALRWVESPSTTELPLTLLTTEAPSAT